MNRSVFITVMFKLVGVLVMYSGYKFLRGQFHPSSPWRDSLQWARASSVSGLHDYNQGDTPHTVGLLWTSDEPEADTSTWHLTTLTRDRHPCPRRNSNPQTQHASERRPTTQTARTPGSFRDQEATICGLVHKNLHLASTSLITNEVLQRGKYE
jgi:hypothetical protein